MQHTVHRRAHPSEGPTCRLVAVGDLMLSGEVARRHRPGPGLVRMFDEVAPILPAGTIISSAQLPLILRGEAFS